MKNLNIKIARMEMGISQIQLAEMAGVTRQTIGMIEAGDFNPSGLSLFLNSSYSCPFQSVSV